MGTWAPVLIASLFVSAATAEEPPATDAAKRGDTLRLVEATGIREKARAQADAAASDLSKGRTDVPAGAWAEVAGAITDELVAERVEVLEETLSSEEIRALADFYETPLGRRLVDAEVKIAADVEARAADTRDRIAKRIKERLEAAGYDSTILQRPPAPVRVGEGIVEPRKIKNANPEYPAAAKAAHVQGVVILECHIRPDGTVEDVKVLRGIPLLDDAAVKAVRQWAYTPTLLNGVAVPVIMTVTVNFRLSP
jgi:TonB family protein